MFNLQYNFTQYVIIQKLSSMILNIFTIVLLLGTDMLIIFFLLSSTITHNITFNLTFYTISVSFIIFFLNSNFLLNILLYKQHEFIRAYGNYSNKLWVKCVQLCVMRFCV